MRRAEGRDTPLYMNGNTVMNARGGNLYDEGQSECPLPFVDFSLTHLTRCQKRRELTFCLWITVRWVPSKEWIRVWILPSNIEELVARAAGVPLPFRTSWLKLTHT